MRVGWPAVPESFAGHTVDRPELDPVGAGGQVELQHLEAAADLLDHGGAVGLPGYEVVHYQHSYLRARRDLPGRRSPDGNQGAVSGDLLSYLRAEPELALVAYSPLLAGGYVRPDKPLGVGFDHPGTATRLAALRAVAEEAGATVNQVVLAWLIGGEVPAIPLVGASSVAQLNERLAAVDLELTADQRTRLDAAR